MRVMMRSNLSNWFVAIPHYSSQYRVPVLTRKP